MDSYFIKEGYISNPVRSFDVAPGENYWSDSRLKASEILQYHVYELAYKNFLNSQFKSVLDIGCGPGLKMRSFFGKDISNKEIVLIDQPSAEGIVKKMFPEATFYSANLEDENYRLPRKFDLIICSDVIEHLGNPDALLSIIKNHLSKNGIVVISTPDRDMRRGPDNNQSPNPDHVREWNRNEFAQYVKFHDFTILRHINLPSIKLSGFQMMLQKIFYKRINKATWYPCQTIVAKLK